MTYSLTLRSNVALLVVTVLIPASAAAQGAAISNAQLFEAVGVRDGTTVCEIGAGDGALTLAAARVVGSQGRVFTSELGEDRVNALQGKIAGSGLTQITVVSGDPIKTNFPDSACDAVFMRDVYHHFSNPAAMNARARLDVPSPRLSDARPASSMTTRSILLRLTASRKWDVESRSGVVNANSVPPWASASRARFSSRADSALLTATARTPAFVSLLI